MNNVNLVAELENTVQYSKIKPFIFRTRLERVLNRIISYSKSENNITVLKQAEEIKQKFLCLSDQSNISVDGTLKSYEFMKDDIEKLNKLIKEND